MENNTIAIISTVASVIIAITGVIAIFKKKEKIKYNTNSSKNHLIPVTASNKSRSQTLIIKKPPLFIRKDKLFHMKSERI